MYRVVSSNFNIADIFEQYKNKVYRLALSISRNEKDAEDIMQNTFLKVIKNLAYFRNRASLSTWIYRIAYNEALMYLRKRKSQFKLTDNIRHLRSVSLSGLFVNWSRLPDKELLNAELKERISNAIRRMPIKYRMALLLNNVEGLPLKESAKIMGLKMNSLKTRLHRARLIIRSDMIDYFRDRGEEQEPSNKRCGIWMGFIYNYINGTLNKKRKTAFKAHIKDCIGCNSFLDTYLGSISITQALECTDIPDELKDKIETFIFKYKHTKN